MMITPTKILSDPRLAGAVLRYHTWQQIGTQDLAQHQWNVARILYALTTNPPEHLVKYALFHDLGEIGSGDVPFPIKRDNPDLKVIMDRIEHSSHSAMVLPWGLPGLPELSVQDKLLMKLCDMIDMFEWGLHQQLMGNRFGEPVAKACWNYVDNNISNLENETWKQNARGYVNRRISTWRP